MKTKKVNKLVAQAQLGKKEALAKLYNEFYSQIYYFIFSRINNAHDAQELVSETFLSMIEGINKFKGDSSFKNYLFGIAKNKLRDYIKNKYKAGGYVLESTFGNDYFDTLQTEPRDDKHKNKLRTILSNIYSMMRPRYAKVLHLRYNEMNSIEETARIMGVSTNNVKVMQHRAIKQASLIWNKIKRQNDKTEEG